MKRSVTLKDIAHRAGVHVSTASRALDSGRRETISEAVIKQIRDAADELGYRPNRLASGLRTKRSMAVGVVIPDIANVLFPPIVRGIESVLEPLGYSSILVNTDNEADREARLLEVLRGWGVDGIVHAAVPRDAPAVASLARDGMPLVTLNRKIDGSDIPFVINDEAEGIRLAVRHLRELGHRSIAHLAGPQNLSTGRMRLAAWRDAVANLHVAGRPDPVVEARKFDESEGGICARRLLDSGAEFTAIVCANDRLALGAIALLRSEGVSCPADVSVTGFNDMPFMDLVEPALTTVRIRQFEAGAVSARKLLEVVEGRLSTEAMETMLPVELIVRDSTRKL